jgi:hypothetical protein
VAQTSQFTWHGRAWFMQTQMAARRGVQLALEHILAESNKIVPLDEGTLERSGTVSMAPDGLHGAVVYDTPYAVRQHEELSYRHLPGRQAKYLETAMNTHSAEAMAIVAAEIRRNGFLGGRLG